MFYSAQIKTAVAVFKPDDRIAIVWNARWRGFMLPITKIPRFVSPERAAVQAAAEAFKLPCRVVEGVQPWTMEIWQQSARDQKRKNYHFHLIPVELHPDFAHLANRAPGVLMVDLDELWAGEYQPLSPTVLYLLDAWHDWSWQDEIRR